MTKVPHSYILVIDDDSGIRESIRLILETEGFHVKVASNGVEALKVLAHDSACCLIFVDIMMPVMDGWAFIKQKQNSSKIADLPIVVISAFTDSSQKSDKSLNIDAFLAKPIKYDSLVGLAEHYGSHKE